MHDHGRHNALHGPVHVQVFGHAFTRRLQLVVMGQAKLRSILTIRQEISLCDSQFLLLLLPIILPRIYIFWEKSPSRFSIPLGHSLLL